MSSVIPTVWFLVFTNERRDFDPIKTLSALGTVLDVHFSEHPNEQIVLQSSDPFECSSTYHYDAYQDSTADDLAASIDHIGIFSSASDALASAKEAIVPLSLSDSF